MKNLTCAYKDSDRSFVAKRRGLALDSVVFGIDGRSVVMLFDGIEIARMAISGDVLGNGMNRAKCESAMFKAATK